MGYLLLLSPPASKVLGPGENVPFPGADLRNCMCWHTCFFFVVFFFVCFWWCCFVLLFLFLFWQISANQHFCLPVFLL